MIEVDAHLREATDSRLAQGVDRAQAEAQAVAAFGSADVVAARMRRETAPIAVRRAAGLALVALGVLLLPLYVVPENLLPPAPWEERPGYLGLLLVTALVTWVFAGVHAAFAFVAPAAHGGATAGQVPRPRRRLSGSARDFGGVWVHRAYALAW